ncbi:glucosaminidase domain-containing protein [Telmatospirillum sp. J64-1]|uniref:glucosaminidase domain-containing protein n=1 Tax=Telmatospirillum sp. J64-1 TaxID=2502183 RepID=UPI00115D60A1|nr:glucosaminidase domain-containing protein [Telmatospirillum sp. J64-1]
MNEGTSPQGWFERLSLGVLGLCVVGSMSLGVSGISPKITLPQRADAPVMVEADMPEAASLSAQAEAHVLYLPEADRRHAERLHEAFETMGYRLDAVSEGSAEVPRVFLSAVPHDLNGLNDIQMRKEVFLRILLPLVLAVNEEIAADRERLLDLQARRNEGLPLTASERAWLASIAERYGVQNASIPVLLRRVDEIPPSLALAQAVEESGWGTSRFAREGNALFGQVTWKEENGLEPLGGGVRIRAFDDLMTAVRGYAHNLNTHRAYNDFRRMRAAMRSKDQPLDGYALAGTLLAYSERGEDYITNLRSIMRSNDLRAYEMASLGSTLVAGDMVAGM